MQLLRSVFADRVQVKIALFTFFTVFLVFLVFTAWQQDTWTTAKSLFESLEDTATSENIDFSNSGFKISNETAHATPISNNTRPAVVAAGMQPEDLYWLDEVVQDWDVFPFIVTDRDMPPHLTTPANKGREAMVYLSYIIYNYENLPPYAIFSHGHRKSWHQPVDIVKMINDLQVDVLAEEQYISFRCSWAAGCPAELRPIDHDAVVWGDGQHLEETEDAIAEAWPRLFPTEEISRTLASPCCAQFAATREAMLRHSKDDYVRMRAWLLNTSLADEISGRVFEKLWAYIMTGEPVRCPTPRTCACKFFGSCGVRIWPRPPKALRPLPVDW